MQTRNQTKISDDEALVVRGLYPDVSDIHIVRRITAIEDGFVYFDRLCTSNGVNSSWDGKLSEHSFRVMSAPRAV